MKVILSAVVWGLLSAGSSASAADPQPAAASPVSDRDVETFLSLLRAAKGAEAVEGLLASSPLWAQKAGTRETMIGQIDAAVRAYGPVTGYEKVKSDALGSMVVREYYLVQHRDMVVRWEFDLVRSGTGWHIGYFGFTDQPTNWF